MNHPHRFWAVIPAAGIGQRMGSVRPKQYLRIGQRTILDHTLARFIDTRLFERIVVAIQADDSEWPNSEFVEHDLIRTASGGAERSDSVLNALRHLAGEADAQDWVLVHDAARPCVTRGQIQYLIDAVGTHPVGGILALPIMDTVKIVEQTSIRETMDRRQLWRAQTPQMFRLGPLTEALERANGAVTDESSAMEQMGMQPIVVKGHPTNIKITEADDLALAAFYLQQEEIN